MENLVYIALIVILAFIWVPVFLPKEGKNRLRTFMAMSKLAWASLFYDSRAFAIVLANSVRTERDALITSVVMKDGRRFNQHGHEIKEIS